MSHPSDAFTTIVHPDVAQYLVGLQGPADLLLGQLEAYALSRGFPLVGRLSGVVMGLLARSIGARRVFEFGSGFGFSAYFFAEAVGPDGQVIGAEKDLWELEAFARFYADHPFRARVDLRQGDAFDVLAATEGDFDVIFLDLDKARYPLALQAAAARLRPGGLLLADNVLWGGKVTRAEVDPDTASLQLFNQQLHNDPRFVSTILPVGDGLAVGWRR